MWKCSIQQFLPFLYVSHNYLRKEWEINLYWRMKVKEQKLLITCSNFLSFFLHCNPSHFWSRFFILDSTLYPFMATKQEKCSLWRSRKRVIFFFFLSLPFFLFLLLITCGRKWVIDLHQCMESKGTETSNHLL